MCCFTPPVFTMARAGPAKPEGTNSVQEAKQAAESEPPAPSAATYLPGSAPRSPSQESTNPLQSEIDL